PLRPKNGSNSRSVPGSDPPALPNSAVFLSASYNAFLSYIWRTPPADGSESCDVASPKISWRGVFPRNRSPRTSDMPIRRTFAVNSRRFSEQPLKHSRPGGEHESQLVVFML